MFSKRLIRLSPIHRASLPSSARIITLTSQNRANSTTPKRPLVPRKFPTSGFEVIDEQIKVEEETLPFYNPNLFCPVTIGQIFAKRYQVVAKLGFGTTSTTWLCHDLLGHRYVTLKVHVNTITLNRELEVYRHIKDIESDHPGREMIRMFKLQGPHGIHEIFILPPLGLSLGLLQEMAPGHALNQPIPTMALQQVLVALDFLHGLANPIHTDIHAGNLLIGIADESKLAAFEEAGMDKPTARKMAGGPYGIGIPTGPLFLCDFGEARIGSQHEGVAMPIQYRAPEIILDMPWGRSVDMWSAGLLAWDLLVPESLFQVYDAADPTRNEAHHLANMIALLGPRPLELLKRSSKSRKYWDENGNWKDIVPIPMERTLDSLAIAVEEGKDKDNFLDFVRGVLRWGPEERLHTSDSFAHPWVWPELQLEQ
ncbi:kinase-like protein [Xylariaceae sp. FL0016]|nr:kinase-like protein [Xylariaceae sp. FL0016]